LILMVMLVGCESSATRDRLDLLSDQIERQERSWTNWRQKVVEHMQRQDSLVLALEDSLESARLRLSLTAAERDAASAACQRRRR